MLTRENVKNPLRRKVSRSALVMLSAPKGGGFGRMFVPAPQCWRRFLISRQFASQCVGFVSTLPITLRLGLIHIRRIGLRAANSACRRLSCVSHLSLCSFLSLFGSLVPCQSLGLLGASGMFCFVLCSLFSSSSWPLSFWPAACVSLSVFVFCVCWRPV